MYYHILIEVNNHIYYEFDKINLLEIEEEVIIPFLEKKEFQFDGYFISADKIDRILIKETGYSTKEFSEFQYKNMDDHFPYIVAKEDIIYNDQTIDITKQIFSSAKLKSSIINKDNILESNQNLKNFNEVFIVHGHDEAAKNKTARFIQQLGFKPIILHEQASSGNTIIEKIEEYSNVDFGIVLYTPCDKGGKNDEEVSYKARARQNVVFEHGYLIGKIGRKNVCALVKGEIETPNDISGVVYVSMDDNNAWHMAIAKELKSAGYEIDMNKLV